MAATSFPPRGGFRLYPSRPLASPTVQPSLFVELTQTVSPDVASGASIAEQFAAFHAANPQVYFALRRLALGLRGLGVQSYGIAGLFEQLRWNYTLQTRGDAYRLNNNYRSHYARLLMEKNPSLAGFFETRQLQTA